MRCVRVLVVLLFISVCWAQQVADTEELPQQQVSTRRRRVSDLADAEGEDGDVATQDDGEEGRLPTPNRPNRPRNPNRRRRKRKRIPPPRPLYEDYEDTLAFPTTGDRPDAPDHERFLDERVREPPTGPEHRSLPSHHDRRRLRDDDDDVVEDDDRRPLRRRPPPSPDREGQPTVHRPFREQHPGYVLNEDGELRPQRPLRRRRKNRRRPPIGPSEGIREESDVVPTEISEDVLPVNHDKDATPDDPPKTPEGIPPRPEGERGRNGEIDGDIPLGSLRGEVRLPTHPRQKPRPSAVEVDTEDEGARRVQTTTPESLPAENLPSNNFDNLPPRQRRRRIRPRAQNKSSTTTERVVVVEENTAPPERDEMLSEREPLKLREEAPMIHKDEDKDSIPAATSAQAEEDSDLKDTSIVSGDITLQTTPIKISLSDLLREKNISIEEILKDADEEAPPPPPRFQRPLKPRPPPPTPKTIVTPRLTQLSRVHQFLQKPRADGDKKEGDSKKETETKVVHNQRATTSTTTTHRAYTQTTLSTHRTHAPTTTTRVKYAPTTLTTPTTRASVSPTTARERVVGRPVGFGARAPALNMQETEEIDPVKMTGKPTSRAGNSKAAEFLKSRVRLPPSSLLFPSVKAVAGAATARPSTPDQEPLAASNVHATPATPNTESNRIPGPAAESETLLTNANVPVYVLNPKYYKASQPKPETHVIPSTTRRADTPSTTEGAMITDADPVRLNIPLKSTGEGEASEGEPTHGKSAEDEIVELLETENGSSRLSRILASRNMTLSELIEHRERGASQQHISDIFLRDEASKATPGVEPTTTETQTTPSVTHVPTTEQVQTTKKLNVEIVEEEEEEDEEENSKRVPRVFEGLAPFKPKVADAMPELEFHETYPESTLEVGTDYVIETYRTDGKHENPGKVREIVTKLSDTEERDEFAGLPSGMKSAILASSAILGLAVFVFLAIFVTCKVRRRQSVRRRYANRSPILSHDVEKSRSMTPVLRHSGYKDMTEERRYYLWNTIRKTLRYK